MKRADRNEKDRRAAVAVAVAVAAPSWMNRCKQEGNPWDGEEKRGEKRWERTESRCMEYGALEESANTHRPVAVYPAGSPTHSRPTDIFIIHRRTRVYIVLARKTHGVRQQKNEEAGDVDRNLLRAAATDPFYTILFSFDPLFLTILFSINWEF